MMKFGQIWRRKSHSTDSHFVSALDRVREIRDHAGWEPLTPPANIQQRADRVADAREHIVIPPLGTEHETRPPQKASRRDWGWDLLRVALIVPLGFMTILLVALIVSETPDNFQFKPSRNVFSVGESYTNLTGSMADRFARVALKQEGFDLSDWRVIPTGDLRDVYLHRSSELEGYIVFQHASDQSTVLLVTIKLEPEGKRIVCTIDPQ